MAAMEQKNIFGCVKLLVYRQATHVNSTMDGGTYTSASFVMIGSGNRSSGLRYRGLFQRCRLISKEIAITKIRLCHD